MSNYRRAPSGYQPQSSGHRPPADYSLQSLPERPLQGDARSKADSNPQASTGTSKNEHNATKNPEQPPGFGSQLDNVAAGSRVLTSESQNKPASPPSVHPSHLASYVRQADAAMYNGAGSGVNNFARSVRPDDSASNYGKPNGQHPGYYPQGIEFTRPVKRKKRKSKL